MATVHSTPSRRRILQNYLLVWVDAKIKQSTSDFRHSLQQLRAVVSDFNVFTEAEACVHFLQSVKDEKAFVITSGAMGQALLPQIHSMTQVDTIFIFCGDRARHKPWSRQWSKIKDVYTRIEPICEALQQSAKQCNEEYTPMSFMSAMDSGSPLNLKELEPSFMYTQLFKDAFLDMRHEQKAIQDLVKYCRETKSDLPSDLKVIDDFERDYTPKRAIWWYTRECFIYQMLNRALRLLEADIIVNMGFFVRDLHRQIEQLHREQVDQYGGQTFTLYRGQGLSAADLVKLKSSQGGLTSFNSFVSTSKNEAVSLDFAKASSQKEGTVGILFVMTIDPTLKKTPFADVGKFSYFDKKEAELLFSMHSVFRIGQAKRLDKQDRLWEVRLTLTADDDPQLRLLTKTMADEAKNYTGWERVGHLLISVAHLKPAEELFTTLLGHTSDTYERAKYHHQLGRVKKKQGDYKGALSHFEKALHILQRALPADHPDLATSYNNIGGVYSDMGENSKALSYYEKALHIQQNHPELCQPIILIWPLPTTILEWCIRTWERTRKHCRTSRKRYI